MEQERRLAGLTLTRPNRLVASVLGGLDVDEAVFTTTTRWGNALLASRDRWADTYRGGRRYSDRDEEPAQNRLAGYRRAGGK